MLSCLLTMVVRDYGFYGVRGFFGVVLGIVLAVVFIWGIWAVFEILAKKFGNDNTNWMFQILRVVLIVFTVYWFVGKIFGILPI